MFAVVEDNQGLRTLERSNERIILGIALLQLDLHDCGDAIKNKRWIAERREVYKTHAIRKLLEQLRSNLDCKPRLSATA